MPSDPLGLLVPAAMIAAAVGELAAKAWPKPPPKPPEWRSEAMLTHPPRRKGSDPP